MGVKELYDKAYEFGQFSNIKAVNAAIEMIFICPNNDERSFFKCDLCGNRCPYINITEEGFNKIYENITTCFGGNFCPEIMFQE